MGLPTPPHTATVAALLLGAVVLMQQFTWLEMHNHLPDEDDRHTHPEVSQLQMNGRG